MNPLLLNEIRNIKEYLSSLTSNVFGKQQVLKWFQDLCNMLCDFLLKIAQNVHNAKESLNQQTKDTMLLYLLQLSTTLSVLINIFSMENQIGITIHESRNCIMQHIYMCLTGLESVIDSTAEDNHSAIGFVKFMDLALDKIAAIDVEQDSNAAPTTTEEARKMVEEVLSHAMSIAQLALKEDGNAIKGSSKEVLYNLDFLTNELSTTSPNISMCNLYIDATCDKLCALERKVNAAVMKLALKGFSECTKPLEDLHRFCLRSQQDEEALDEIIADFDMHVDRMIQVGLFAVACSTDRNCTLKMRSCLASLEALEGELVPALTALIKDCTVHNLYHAEILKNYWIKQAQELKKFIYLIIDPIAFCQVTFEVIRDINEDLEERFRDLSMVDKNHVKPITLQSKILYEMLLVSLVDSPPENQDVIRNYLNDVICVTMEIDAAAEKLLREDEICKDNVFRVFKRCKVQENILRKLLMALGNVESKQHLQNDPKANNVKEESDFDDKTKTIDEHSLAKIALRGKQILQDRSVLYKSPKKMTSNISANHVKPNKPMPLSRLVHLRNMQFSHSRSVLEPSSCDLQITDILNNLTALSTSMKS